MHEDLKKMSHVILFPTCLSEMEHTINVVFTDGLAVMSVDLGSEFMKVALVKPGVPMDIVINRLVTYE